MDFDEYVAARYGRLIEHAVLLGAPEGEAGTYVDRVLIDQRKRIRRADDPDPMVRAALEQALSGQRPKTRSTGPVVALALVVVAAIVGVALTYRPTPEPVPSLFALTGAQAQTLLESRGYDVSQRLVRTCEPDGLVVTSDPVPGTLLRKGETVVVRTAVPGGSDCEAVFGARSDAWAFVQFALGGPAPEFADLVHVVVDRSEDAQLIHRDAVDQARWGGTLREIADAARQTPSTATGMPSLVVSQGVPPRTWCGVPRPAQGGERETLRFEIDPTPDGGGCPLTVDLYRDSEQVIDSVVVYTPKR